MSINKRIEELRDSLYNGKNKEFANNLGVSSQAISNYVRDGYNIGRQVINSILNVHPEINPSWLLTGDGEMLKSDKPKYEEAKAVDLNYISVPLIAVKAQAGYLNGFNEVEFIEDLPTVRVNADRTFHGKYRCFEVSGDSMDNNTRESICDGDIILGREVKRDLWHSTLHFKDWFFIINHVDGLLVKQIVSHDIERGVIICHSLNPIYGKDFELNLDDVREIYNVIRITDRALRK